MYQKQPDHRYLSPEFMKSQARYRQEKIEDDRNNWGKSLLWSLLFLVIVVGIVVLFRVTF